MSRKVIIISLSAIIAIAALMVGALLLFQTTPTKNAPQVGQTVSQDKIPDYKTCSVIPATTIKSIFGNKISKLSDAQTTGVIALNGEVAQQCDYTFSTTLSNNNSFSIQTYLSNPSTAKGPTGMPMGDKSWFVIPGIKISYTSLYKTELSKDGKSLLFYLSVMTPTKYYLYTITEPQGQAAIVDETAINILAQFANAGDYTVSQPTNAPPAPHVN